MSSYLSIPEKQWAWAPLLLRNGELLEHSPIRRYFRDRPFNLKGGGGFMVFCFLQKIFFGQHKSWNIYFFCRAKREIFFKNLTLGYMTKTLNQIIFFSSTKIRIFFSATLGIRIFFKKKNIPPPPLQVKWSFPYGCEVDHSSQTQHACLMCTVSEHLDTYFEETFN